MTISLGSATELQYQLILSRDLGYLPGEDYNTLEKQLIEVKKMLSGFIRSINKSN